MGARTFTARTCPALAALVLAGMLAGPAAGGALAATCTATGAQPPNVGTHDNSLTGVAALSSCNAWAVGYYSTGTADQTLIEHWNGTSWQVVPSPDPGGSANYNALADVAAISAADVWAVGTYSNGTADQTLIEHWNGTSWTAVPSPDPSTADNELAGVAASSATNVWAVGREYAVPPDGGEGPPHTLIEHWNGNSWRVVSSPNPTSWDQLGAVAATSTSNAWAVGLDFTRSGAEKTLIEHWNGTAWQQVASPNRAASTPVADSLSGVTAASAANVWAVGGYFNGAGGQTLAEHWNGTNWTIVPSPDPGGSAHSNALAGVAFTPTGTAWAVGTYYDGTALQTLILGWNGTAWKPVASPNPGGTARDNALSGAAATSTTNIWAVGDYNNGTVLRTLAVHCC